ncbi:MAG: YbaN family protein [Alphaproteobacteria bacterium]|nr:YbaN family protein [Alphaproteobacteria bacterium]
MEPDQSSDSKPDNLAQCTLRWGLLAFGWLNVGLGMIGVLVPGMPTTVFLIIAVWAFSKSSARFQQWLWNHPKFGASLRLWHEHRVIPMKAKVMAAIMMTASFLYVTFYIAEGWQLPILLAAVMVPAGIYVLTRASVVPSTETPEIS